MATRINFTYYNNFDIDFDMFKNDYQEFNELTDEDMENVDDNGIWDYIYYCLDLDYNDFFDNLKYSRYANEKCVITGCLGLWNGRPQIEPTPCDNLASAIRKCLDNMDYAIIKQVNGHLEVQGIHHDGTNSFEIHLLNNKGLDALCRIEYYFGEANLGCKCYHKAIKGYLI